MRTLLGFVLLLALVAGCGSGLSSSDKALCTRVDSVNDFMDLSAATSSDPTSPESVFAALEGADNKGLAQVGRDYSADHPADSYEYEQRAKKICGSGP